MWKWWRRLWQQLRQFWQRLWQQWRRSGFAHRKFGKKSHQPQPASVAVETNSNGGTSPPLEDSDYEMLFFQILDGVQRGWRRNKVLTYIESFGDRAPFSSWVDWLRRFGERVLQADTDNQTLARQLLKLGNLGCGELSVVAKNIGSRLLVKSLSPEETAEKARDWLEKGNQRIQANDPGGALAFYDQALAIDANGVEAWANRGVALFNLKRYRKSVEAFDRALELNPQYAQGWSNRGFALAASSQFLEAARSYRKVIKLQPNSHEAWQNCGVSLAKAEQHQEALPCYQKALELKPDFPRAKINLGVSLLALRRYDEALATFDEALELDGDNREAWENRGMALAELQRYEEAVAAFDEAVERGYSYKTHYNRGWCCYRLQRYEDAIASFDEILKRDEDNDAANYGKTEASKRKTPEISA